MNGAKWQEGGSEVFVGGLMVRMRLISDEKVTHVPGEISDNESTSV